MKLLALHCPQCGQRLEPKHNEVVVTGCPHCYTAVHIQQTGLQEINVTYTAPATDQIDAWLPFWVFDGRVNIEKRESQGRSKGADEDAARLWGSPRRLYAPAWNVRAGQAREFGSRLVQKQPAFQTIERLQDALLTEAIITHEDALKLLDFIVLTIEARRKDYLRNILFQIEAGKPQLWAIPAQDKGGDWQLVAKS
jgi:hypothetical protein